MRWFKDADGKWYYGDRPYPTHAMAQPIPRSEGLAETMGDVLVTAKGGAPTTPTASPFSNIAMRPSSDSGAAAEVILTEEQAQRFLPPRAGESRSRWLDRVGLGYMIQPGDEKRAPHVHSSIGPRSTSVADHGQAPTGGGDGLARAAGRRAAASRAKRPPSPIHLPRRPLRPTVGSTRSLRIQGPPMRVVVNVDRRIFGGKVVEPGVPTTFDVYPDGTSVQVYPKPDPPGTRVVLQPDGTYLKILPTGQRIPLGVHPYDTPAPSQFTPMRQRADVAKDLDALRKHAMAEAKAIEDPDLRKAALAVVDAITDLALDPSGSTDDLRGAIDALDNLARKQGQGSDLAHAARVNQDGRKALGVLGK